MGIKVAIAAAVIVLVAVGVGAKVSQNKQKNDSATVSTPTPVSNKAVSSATTPKLQTTIVVDPATAGWNNLTNNKAGVTLRIPNNWTDKTIDANTVEFREAGKTYTVGGKDTYGVLLKFEANTGAKSASAVAAEKLPKATKSNTDVSGYAATRAEDATSITTYFATPTNVITLTTPKGIDDATVQTIYNQMVKTLTFIQTPQ